MTAGCGERTPATVDRLDVDVAVLADGTATVHERIAVQFAETPAAAFHRRSPVWRHDGISDVVASVDGRPSARDGSDPAAPSHIRVEGPGLDVTWTFDPPVRGTHALTLSYRAANVISLSGIRGTVSWLALPAGRDRDASDVHLALSLPDTAILLQDPWVEQPGWTVSRLPHGMTAFRAGVPRSESATLGIEFTVDQMTPMKPRWQADAEFAGEFVPAFVSAGLFILVVGAGVLGMLRWKFQSSAAGAGDPERIAASRDLRRAGWAIVVAGLAAWAYVAAALLGRFGMWPQAIPASMLVVGIMFLVAGARRAR